MAVMDSGKSAEHLKKMEETKTTVMNLFRSDGWKHISGDSLEKGIIHYQTVKEFGRKLFRLQGLVNIPAKDLWYHMSTTNNESTKWNKSVVLVKTLEEINDHTVITYSTAAEALGGLISARDFINLRQWIEIDHKSFLHHGVVCEHPSMPEQKGFVRGENGPGGLLYEVYEEDPTKCHLSWIVNTDPKGWIPKAAVEKAMKGLLENFFVAMKDFYKDGIPT